MGTRIGATAITFLLAAVGCGGDDDGAGDGRNDGDDGDDGAGSGVELVVTAISDRGGSPVEGVRVQVGDSEWSTTDADGNAIVAGVEAPFTVRVHQKLDNGGLGRDNIWVLTGQAENPLVVRVEGSQLPTRHVATIMGTVLGSELDDESRVWLIARGGTQRAEGGLTTQEGHFIMGFAWEGPASHTLVLDALKVDVSGVGPPVHYFSHGTATVPVDDPEGLGAVVFGVEFGLDPVEEGSVGGTVTPPDSFDGYLHPILDLEFEDGSRADYIVDDSVHDPGSYEFKVPLVDGTIPIVGFYAEDGSTLAYSRAERKLDGPATGIDIDLPRTVELVEPPDDAALDLETAFRWEALPDGARYALNLFCSAGQDETRREVYVPRVETAETEATLPAVPDVDLSGLYCRWRVGWFNEDALAVVRNGGTAANPRESWSAFRYGMFP